MSDKPPGAETANVMQAIARSLDDFLNQDLPKRRYGFAVFVFEIDKTQGARTNYASNCVRQDVEVALKEVLARWGGQAEVSGKA